MTAKVIRGPWKKTDQTEKELEKAQLLADCDQIASACMVSVLHTLAECSMAPEDPDDENIAYICDTRNGIKRRVLPPGFTVAPLLI